MQKQKHTCFPPYIFPCCILPILVNNERKRKHTNFCRYFLHSNFSDFFSTNPGRAPECHQILKLQMSFRTFLNCTLLAAVSVNSEAATRDSNLFKQNAMKISEVTDTGNTQDTFHPSASFGAPPPKQALRGKATKPLDVYVLPHSHDDPGYVYYIYWYTNVTIFISVARFIFNAGGSVPQTNILNFLSSIFTPRL